MAMAENNSPNEDDLWRKNAKDELIKFAWLAQSQYSSMDVCSYSVLRDKIAASLFSVPENVSSSTEKLTYNNETFYNKKQQETVVKLAECIFKNQVNRNREKIYASFMLIVGRTFEKESFQTFVIKIPGEKASYYKYIGTDCRVYKDWDDYLEENTLPKAEICYPRYGDYVYKEKELQIDFKKTPACSDAKKVLMGLDIASAVTGLVAGGVTTACMFFPLAMPVALAAYGAGILTGSYGAGRSIEYLVNRDKHGQTLHLSDPQARNAWLGATVPFFGMAAGGATLFAVNASRVGIPISQAGRVVINMTNGINCVAHSFCVVSDIGGIIQRKLNDDDISPYQVYQCIASALMFANVVISTHQARMLLQTIPMDSKGSWASRLFRKLSQTVSEDGITVRYTNIVSDASISTLISDFSRFIQVGSILFIVPLVVAENIGELAKYIFEKLKEKPDIAGFVLELLPYIGSLWACIHQHSYFTKTQNSQKQKSSYTSASNSRKNESQNSKDKFPADSSFYSSGDRSSRPQQCKKKEDETEFMHEKAHINKSCINVEENGTGQILIDGEWEDSIQEKLEDIASNFSSMAGANSSFFEDIHSFIFLYGKLQEEVEEKEKKFQEAKKRMPSLTEKDMENIFGIEGDRKQFFAHEVMNSYKDLKFARLRREYTTTFQLNNEQLPLLNGEYVKIKQYRSSQKSGVKSDYFDILKKAGIPLDENNYREYYQDNVYFLEFLNPKFPYCMAGVINFHEGNDTIMEGFVVLCTRPK